MSQTLDTNYTDESQESLVSVDVDTKVASVTSATADYVATPGSGTLAALVAARDNLSRTRAQKADAIALIIGTVVDSQAQASPEEKQRFVAVARQLALALLPNGTAAELGI